jgi:GNAT superfamily N-acetyltransferase
MDAADLDAVMQIASVVHPLYPEDRAVFEERLALFPPGMFVLATAQEVIGYAVSHPWSNQPPDLNTLIRRIPPEPVALYIHDVALLPEARGEGHALLVLTAMRQTARRLNIQRMMLVAVGASRSFWQHRGFEVLEGAQVRSYGDGAVVMTADV